jgi:hypothetical protein
VVTLLDRLPHEQTAHLTQLTYPFNWCIATDTTVDTITFYCHSKLIETVELAVTGTGVHRIYLI